VTGFPDDFPGPAGGWGGPGPHDGPDGDAPAHLLHPPGVFLPPPPGAFERIRRRAARRRRTRAAAGAVTVAALVTGAVLLVGRPGPDDSGEGPVPPAATSLTTVPPAPSAPPSEPGRSPAPTASVVPSGPPPSGTRTATPGPTASPEPTRAGGSAPTPAGGTPVCAAGQLTASLGGGDAGAGSLYRPVVLTNSGRTTCRLAGFPGVSLLDADGGQIGEPATRTQSPYRPVVLLPGEAASGTLRTVNRQGSCLPASTRVRIYPPGSRAPLEVPGQITVCGGTFTVTPLAAGSTGNPSG
jgi:Protein of unknown function (DUF4232)